MGIESLIGIGSAPTRIINNSVQCDGRNAQADALK